MDLLSKCTDYSVVHKISVTNIYHINVFLKKILSLQVKI